MQLFRPLSESDPGGLYLTIMAVYYSISRLFLTHTRHSPLLMCALTVSGLSTGAAERNLQTIRGSSLHAQGRIRSKNPFYLSFLIRDKGCSEARVSNTWSCLLSSAVVYFDISLHPHCIYLYKGYKLPSNLLKFCV